MDERSVVHGADGERFQTGDSDEWRFLKDVKKRGLPEPIKELCKTFIGKETRKMSTNRIGTTARNSANISSQLEQITFNSIRKAIPDKIIISACLEAHHQYRCRVITPILTVLHMVLAAIWPEESFNASWQLLWSSAVGRYPELAGRCPSPASVTKARYRLPLAVWQELFDWTCDKIKIFSDPFAKWKGHRIVLLDGTCVSMPDTADLFKQFGTNTGYNGRGKYPLARMVTVCLANTMAIIDYTLGCYTESEDSLAFKLFGKLEKSDLLVADRRFAAAHYYARYRSMGLEFLTRIHQCTKMSGIKRICSYGNSDFIGWLKINPVYLRKNPALPTRVMVRFIQTTFRIRGRRTVVWLATSLLDGQKYPACEIAQIYASRWRIETLFHQTKINMGADVLRSRRAEAIRKEIVARLIAVNIVRMIMLESAANSGVQPLRLSFAYTVRAIIGFAPALAAEPQWKLTIIYKAMLCEIAAHLVPERPGRIEPRAIRRETKHYPSLKTTRAQWRAAYAA